MRDFSQVYGKKSKLKRNIMKVKMTDMDRESVIYLQNCRSFLGVKQKQPEQKPWPEKSYWELERVRKRARE